MNHKKGDFLYYWFVFFLIFSANSKAEQWSEESHEIFSTDYNSDGLDDLIIKGRPRIVSIPYDISVTLSSEHSSFVLVANSDGSYAVQNLENISELDSLVLTETDFSVRSGDFNGDGEADFLLESPTNSELVLHSSDNGETLRVGQVIPQSALGGDSEVSLADVDLDGRDDLIIVEGGKPRILQADAEGGFPDLASGETGNVSIVSGKMSVGQDGSANYSVPLSLPPGRGGLKPSLSLSYNSSSGIGYLGVGWSISGLQSISRCRPIIPTDGTSKAEPMSAEEKFCLNGSRLIVVSGEYGESGAEYRTEKDQISRVRSYGSKGSGPEYFKVWSKSGRVLEFGNTVDSRVSPSGESSVSSWSLNKVSDEFGNAYTITYHFDDAMGEQYLDNIEYGPGARIDFVYEDRGTHDGRKDILWRFKAGSEYSITKRLAHINTSVDGVAVRRFELQYEHSPSTSRSRLKTLTECAFNRSGSSDVCSRPTEFSYREGESGYDATGNTMTDGSFNVSRPMYFDANGDGYSDLVFSRGGVWAVMEGSETGFTYVQETGITAGASQPFASSAQPILLDERNGKYGLLVVRSAEYDSRIVAGKPAVDAFTWGITAFYKNNGVYVSAFSGDVITTLGARPIVGDFNGDGKEDIFGFVEDLMVEALTNTYAENDIWHDESEPGIPEVAKNAFVSIRTDAVYEIGSVAFFTHFVDGIADDFTRSSTYSLAGSFSTDVNGNGINDVIAKRGSEWERYSPYTTGESVTDAAGKSHDVYGFERAPIGVPTGDGESGNGTMADINIDGLPDILVRIDEHWKAYINKGNGFSAYDTGLTTTEESPTLIPINYNNDGSSDFLIKQDEGWDVYSTLLDRHSVSLRREQTLGIIAGDELPAFSDINADGLGDLVIYDGADLTSYYHKSGKPDLLKEVIDGAGFKSVLSYEPTSNPEVHTFVEPSCQEDEPSSCFPYRNIRTGIYVVDSLTENDGVGGQRVSKYHYTGAKIHLQGRGFLGFSEQTIEELWSGKEITRSFRQDYPFAGSLTNLSVSKGSTDLLQVNNQWSERQTHSGDQISFPFLEKSTRIEHDGAAMSVTQTVRQVDDYANVVGITTTVGSDISGDVVTDVERVVQTDRLYEALNTTDDHWRVGFMTSETVSAGGESRTTTQQPWEETSVVYKRTENANTDRWKTTTYSYNTMGNPFKVNVAGANAAARDVAEVKEWYRDLLPARVENARGHTTSFTYDPRNGQIVTTTDPNQLKTITRYDAFGRPIYKRDPDGSETHILRQWCGTSCPENATVKQSKVVINGAEKGLVEPPSVSYLDIFGRVLRQASKNPDGKKVYSDRLYDPVGRMTAESTPFYPGNEPKWTTYSAFDEHDRPGEIASPGGGRKVLSYGASTEFNRKQTVIETVRLPDGSGVFRTTEQHFDALGQLREAVDAHGTPINYQYDGFGRITNTTVDNDSSTIIAVEYDAAGNKEYVDDPNTGRVDFTYDGIGQLKSKTDAKDQPIEYEYDLLGRPDTRTESFVDHTGKSVVHLYDWDYDDAENGIGMPVRVTGPDYAKVYSYDALSRMAGASVTLLSQPTFEFSYQYDGASRPSVITYPSGFSVQAKYNAVGYRVGMSNPSSGYDYWSSSETDVLGQVVKEHFGNGVSTRRGYTDAQGFLESLETTLEGSVIQDRQYKHDTVGNVHSRSTVLDGQSIKEIFSYDNLDRLTNATTNGLASGQRSIDYRYDALGNITYKQGVSDVNGYRYESDRPHAVTKVVNEGVTTTYGYDANGNIVQSGQRQLHYNAWNKPVRIERGERTALFRYGPSGDRFYQEQYAGGSKKRETYYLDGGKYEKIVNLSTGMIKEKSYVGGRLLHIQTKNMATGAQSEAIHYLHKNLLGSNDVVTNALGELVERQSFAPYGSRRTGEWESGEDMVSELLPDGGLDLTSRGFTGHEHLDDFELIHMNGRIYDPVIGRFMSPDPLVQAPTFSQSYNRYSYVWNNPLNATDPSGYSGQNVIRVTEFAGILGEPRGMQDCPDSCMASVTSSGGRQDYSDNLAQTVDQSAGSASRGDSGGVFVSNNGSDVGASIRIRSSTSGTVSFYSDSGNRGDDYAAPPKPKPSAEDIAQMSASGGASVGISSQAWSGNRDSVFAKVSKGLDSIRRYLDDSVTATATGVLGLGGGAKAQAIIDPFDLENSKGYAGAGGVLGASVTATIDFVIHSIGEFSDDQIITKTGLMGGYGLAIGLSLVASDTGETWVLSIGTGIGLSGSGVAGKQRVQSNSSGNPGAAAAARRREQRR